jgi:uncharacterized repeat protein (TIGR01451 family)
VVVTERISDKFQVLSSDPKAASSSGNVVTWNLGGIECNTQAVIHVKGQMNVAGELPNCTSVDYNRVLCMSAVAIAPELKVGLDAAKEALICENIPVNIVVSNTGTGAVRNVQLNYALPEGLVTSDGKREVAYNLGTLNTGDSKSVAVNLRAQKTGTFSHVAKAVAEGGLSASSSTVSTVIKQPVLKVAMSAPREVYAGRNAEFKITVNNSGGIVAQNTVLQGQLPSGCAFVRASDNGQAAGGRVNWNLGNLNAGGSKSVSMTCQTSSTAALQASAVAQAYCADAASATTAVEAKGLAAILLEVVDVDDPIEVGGAERFVIVVTNQGTAVDGNIVVDVKMGDLFEYVSSSGPTRPAAESPTAVKFAPLPSLAPGEKASWQVIGKAKAAGQNLFGVELSSDHLKRAVNETEATTIY